jgi:hypothetical protein
MSCPSCGCKVCYQYDGGVEDHEPWPEDLERCAACGHVFDIEDQVDEEDEEHAP